MCTARLFSQRVNLFALKFLPGQGRPPSTTLGTKNLETLGYPIVKTASLCVPFFHTIPECDGQTDERTDGFTVAYTALVLRSAVIERNHTYFVGLFSHVIFGSQFTCRSSHQLHLDNSASVAMATRQIVDPLLYTVTQ